MKNNYDGITAELLKELDAMQSPISRRRDISPDLDDLEEEYFEAF